MTRLSLFTFLIVALFASSCSKREKLSPAAQNAVRKVAVSTAQAVVRTVPAAFEETGTFSPDETSDIAPLANGRVLKTPVNMGDFVRKGQVICELEHRDAELKLEQAQAQLEQANSALRQAQSRIGMTGEGKFDPEKVPEVAAARAAYESSLAQARMYAADAKRYENLVATGDVSRSAYDKAHTQQETGDAQVNSARQQFEAQVNSARQNYRGIEMAQAAVAAARAQFDQAKKALDDTTIRAPFDGNITARPVGAGQYVATSNKVATIVRIGILKLQLQTPEQRASQVRLGMQVVARVSAYPGREFTGKVTAINASVDTGSRVFIVEARFDNPKSELRPGMFATARVLLAGGEVAVFVPATAVLRDKTTESYQIFTVEKGVARLRVVMVGQAEGDWIRVTSGLNGNETVATGDHGDLFDGAAVETRS